MDDLINNANKTRFAASMTSQIKELKQQIQNSAEENVRIKSLLDLRDTQVETYKKTITALETQIAEMKKAQSTDTDGVRALLAKTQEEKLALEKKYALLSSKMEGSYTPDDLAAYFNKTISAFNAQMGDASKGVSYIINNMDVDLKAQIVKSAGELRLLCDPESGGENAMSTIKISIRAVPV